MCGEHSCVYAWICRLEVNLDCPSLLFQDRASCFLWKHHVGQADWQWVLGVSLSPYFQCVIYLGSTVLKKTICNGSVPIREGNQRATGSGQALDPNDLLPSARLHLQVPEHCQVVTKTLAHEPTGSFQTTNALQSLLLFSQGVTNALKTFSKGEDLLLLCLWRSCFLTVHLAFLGFYLLFFLGVGWKWGSSWPFATLGECKHLLILILKFLIGDAIQSFLFDIFPFGSGTLSRWRMHFQSTSPLS